MAYTNLDFTKSGIHCYTNLTVDGSEAFSVSLDSIPVTNLNEYSSTDAKVKKEGCTLYHLPTTSVAHGNDFYVKLGVQDVADLSARYQSYANTKVITADGGKLPDRKAVIEVGVLQHNDVVDTPNSSYQEVLLGTVVLHIPSTLTSDEAQITFLCKQLAALLLQNNCALPKSVVRGDITL